MNLENLTNRQKANYVIIGTFIFIIFMLTFFVMGFHFSYYIEPYILEKLK